MSVEELLEPVFRLKQAGEPDQATATLEALIEEHADDPRLVARLRIEWTRDYRGGIEPARKALQTALEMGWDDIASRAFSAIVTRRSMGTVQPGELARMAERASALAGTDPELLGHALDARARLAANQGRKQEAKRLWTEAVWQHEACGYRIGVARHLYRVGLVFQSQGSLSEASAFYDRAEEVFAETGDVIGASNVLRAMAENAVAFGHLQEAEQLVRRCITLERMLKRGRGLCTALNALGEVLRTRGDLQAAEDAYKQALDVQDNPFVRMNLALCLQSRGRHEEARDSLRDILVSVDIGEQVAARCLLLPSLAALGDVAGWRDQLGRTQALLEVSRASDPDLAQALEQAGDHWTQRGGPDDLQRAVRAYRLAVAMWHSMSREDSAARCMEAIDRAVASGCRPIAGPWDLQELLGRGSMGVVWLGRHQETGDEAAVKLLHERDPSPRLVAIVEAEARAVARLDHTHIARLVGYGTLDDVAAHVADMTSGTPWLATELATGGTLLRRCGHVRFEEAKGYLLDLLSALAHAHGQGLLHLDLKPENVLLQEGEPRLADFGVAAAVQLLDEKIGRAGTPWYMAPEQFDARTRLSPQTDMYALGCLAVQLLTGSTLYPGAPDAQERAHLRAPVPAISWPPGVPEAFGTWVERLLAKDPAERFERAADAALVLEGMAPQPGERAQRRAVRPSETPTWAAPVPRSNALPVPFAASTTPEHPPLRQGNLDIPAPPASRAPEILEWRPLPMVGREREQDRIWATLRQVAWGSPRAVVVEGPDTLGRNALARSVCARAHELGAADVLRATDDRPPVEAILSELMDPPASIDEADAAVEALWPDLEPSHRRALARSAAGEPSAEAPAALVRALQRPEARRVIVHLAGEGMVPMAEALLRSEAAVLVVLEVETPGILSDELLRRPDCISVSLEPLDDRQIEVLCRRMLPVTPRLASALASRASGHPGLAAELLHRLVADHALSLEDGHWALTAGLQVPELESDDELPPIVEQEGAPCLSALAGLAGLRHSVDPTTWAVLCEMDSEDAAALAHRLTGAGLLRSGPRGLALNRPERKQGLWRQARAKGLLDDALRRAAPYAATPALRGELLLEAGAPRDALPYLLHAVRDDLQSAPGKATPTQRLLADAVRLGGLSPRHPLAVEAALLRIEQLALANDLDRAEKLLEKLPEPPEALRGDLARTEGLLAMKRGDLSHAVKHLATARSLDMDDGDAALYLGTALAGLSRVQGKFDEALEQLDAAREEAEAQGRPQAAAVAWMGLGDIHRHQGRMEEASEALDHAEPLLDPSDPRWVLLRLNQALLALTLGKDDDATGWLDELDALDADRLSPGARRHLTVLRLVLYAQADEATFEARMQQASLAMDMAADPDHAHCLEMAAARATDPARARACLEHAATLWEKLDRAADLERVQNALD